VRRTLLALALTVVVAACGGGDGGDGDGADSFADGAAETTEPQTREPQTSAVPACTPAPLEQRAGRVLIVGLLPVRDAEHGLIGDILDVGVGGVLLLPPNVASTEQVTALVAGIKQQAARPLLVVAGEESGRVSTFRTIFGPTPSARDLAAANTPAQLTERAKEIGARMASVGVNLDLAPVADLDAGPARGIIGDRSFSADPDRAGELALAWARGLHAAGVHPTAKHFPGHGRMQADSHRALELLDTPLAELEASDVKPFVRLIEAGVPAVLLDHIAYAAFDPDRPASLSPKAYAYLRELGFEGVAITDSVGMGAVNLRWPYPEAAVESIIAGADAVLATDGAQARPMRDALVAAVRDGRLPEARLNEAAGRVEALAGGDPEALVCVEVQAPTLR